MHKYTCMWTRIVLYMFVRTCIIYTLVLTLKIHIYLYSYTWICTYIWIFICMCVSGKALYLKAKILSKFRKHTFSKVSIMVYSFFFNLAVRSLLWRVYVSDTVSRLFFLVWEATKSRAQFLKLADTCFEVFFCFREGVKSYVSCTRTNSQISAFWWFYIAVSWLLRISNSESVVGQNTQT